LDETSQWKLIQRIEELTDIVESMEDYLDQVHNMHLTYNDWINQATENIIELQKQVIFLKNRKTPVS